MTDQPDRADATLHIGPTDVLLNGQPFPCYLSGDYPVIIDEIGGTDDDPALEVELTLLIPHGHNVTIDPAMVVDDDGDGRRKVGTAEQMSQPVSPAVKLVNQAADLVRAAMEIGADRHDETERGRRIVVPTTHLLSALNSGRYRLLRDPASGTFTVEPRDTEDDSHGYDQGGDLAAGSSATNDTGEPIEVRGPGEHSG